LDLRFDLRFAHRYHTLDPNTFCGLPACVPLCGRIALTHTHAHTQTNKPGHTHTHTGIQYT
jgi:hypothetical protein